MGGASRLLSPDDLTNIWRVAFLMLIIIIYLSSVTLSEVEKYVSSKGTDFCRPSHVRKEESVTLFELFFQHNFLPLLTSSSRGLLA